MDGEARTSTWTFTQLLSSSSMLVNFHRDHNFIKDYKGRGAQDVHLEFHAAFEL